MQGYAYLWRENGCINLSANDDLCDIFRILSVNLKISLRKNSPQISGATILPIINTLSLREYNPQGFYLDLTLEE